MSIPLQVALWKTGGREAYHFAAEMSGGPIPGQKRCEAWTDYVRELLIAALRLGDNVYGTRMWVSR